ncbi:hypothetical protein BDR03DRAFT_1017759, partial [Suillus americanus]
LGIVSSNDSDGQNIGPVVDNVDEQPGEDPVESIATPQPSMGDTHGLDEDEWFMNMSGISWPT